MRRRNKRPLEFMQKMCIASWVLMACTIMADIVLSWNGREPLPSTTQALIGFVTIFINGGYVTQNITRNCSLNRHGIRIPDVGGKHYMEHMDNLCDDSSHAMSEQEVRDFVNNERGN